MSHLNDNGTYVAKAMLSQLREEHEARGKRIAELEAEVSKLRAAFIREKDSHDKDGMALYRLSRETEKLRKPWVAELVRLADEYRRVGQEPCEAEVWARYALTKHAHNDGVDPT